MKYFEIIACFFLTSHLVLAATRDSTLDLKSNYRLMDEKLTTEKISEMDWKQENPHRQRWLLKRTTSLLGLRTKSREKGKFGIEANGVLTETEGFRRGEGPWYRPMSEFNCSTVPQEKFATQEGVKAALETANQLWVDLIAEEKVKLSVLLDRVVADTPEYATEKAILTFNRWLSSIESQWRRAILSQSPLSPRAQEWKFYRDQAAEMKLCEKSSRPLTKKLLEVSWSEMMEPPQSSKLDISQILTRVPVRFWDGFFTVRLSIQVGRGTLNGRFLIDSSAKKSVISPFFLESQGVIPSWIVVPGVAPEAVQWSPSLGVRAGLGQRVEVDRVEISGFPLPINEFLLHDTEFFHGPNYVAPCCDGVIGSDFLRLYPMEIQSEKPAELRIWPIENFREPEEYSWVEASVNSNKDFVSDCVVKELNKKITLSGIRWDIASEYGLAIHQPWHPLVKQKGNSKNLLWNVQCGSVPIAKEVHASFPSSQQGFSMKTPGSTVGTRVLERGVFAFDLPHGRVWLENSSLPKKEIQLGGSGLHIHYTVEKKKGRQLLVKKIDLKSPAKSLSQAGLKPGMAISEINGKSVEEMDLWEVERILGGRDGNKISIQWKAQNGYKIAPLEI